MNLLKIKDHLKDPLYINSFYMLFASVLISIFGFIFWIVAAKLYSADEVGLATALISVMSLINLFSYFGFDQSIIRFIPNMDKNKVFSTAVTIVSLLVCVFGIVTILFVNHWSSELFILQKYPLIFLFFVLVVSLTSLTGTSFIGLRNAKYYLFLNILQGSRIIFLFVLVFFGAFGIFYSVGLSALIALLISVFWLYNNKIRYTGVDGEFLNDSIHFSVGNYLVGLLGVAPTYIVPLIVLNVLGSSETAYFYISFTIASILFFIPSAFSTSLFVEGSHGEPMKKNVIKSIISIFVLLFFGLLSLYLFGRPLLEFVGPNYLKGYNTMLIIASSSFFVGIYYIYFSIKKVQKKIQVLIFLNLILFTILIGFSYFFTLQFGIIGIGYAWIIGYGLNCLLILFLSKLEFI